jgi:hypothetical protein
MIVDINLFLTILGIVLAVLALPLTYMWGRRSRQRPTLRYVLDYDVLMNTQTDIARDPLRISYGDTVISQVSRTYVAFWNHRGDTVRASDAVEQDPLRVKLPDGDTALQAGIVAYSREQCDIRVTLNDNERSVVDFTFDFLDEGDGFILEIIHQGDSPGVVTGTLRGAEVQDRGKGELSPKALGAIVEKSLEGKAKNIASRCLEFLSAAFPVFMLVVGLLAFRPFREPRLIPLDEFNLRTLEGQNDFASKVGFVGKIDVVLSIGIYLLLAGMVVAILGTAWGFRSKMRRQVPRSIHKNYLGASSKSATTEGPSLAAKAQ